MKEWKARSIAIVPEKTEKGARKSVSWAETVRVRTFEDSAEGEQAGDADDSTEDEAPNTPIIPPTSDFTPKPNRLTIRIIPPNPLRSTIPKAASFEIPSSSQRTVLESPTERSPIDKTDSGPTISGWDSDLTELSNSSDDGESEVNNSSDSDQPLAEVSLPTC